MTCRALTDGPGFLGDSELRWSYSNVDMKKPGTKKKSDIVKVCETCSQEYNPPRNGYEMISRFCSRACARKGRANTW